MIRLRHENLPAGLSALVRRRADGDMEVIVSAALSASRQRAAVRAGLRPMQPARRGGGPLPVPALITLALAGTWLRTIGRLLRVRPVATIAVAAAAVAAAAVVIAAAPHLLGPAGTGRNPAGAPSRSTGGPPAPGGARPSTPTVTEPLPSAMPVAARSPAVAATTPGFSAPQQPPSASTPAASGTAGGNGICLQLLGLRVCLSGSR